MCPDAFGATAATTMEVKKGARAAAAEAAKESLVLAIHSIANNDLRQFVYDSIWQISLPMNSPNSSIHS